MKPKQLLIHLLSVSLFCFIIYSCHNDLYTPESFIIKVDSIHVPGVITSNNPFDIEFFGIIGTDGCHSFSHYIHSLNNTCLIIEALGNYDYRAGLCPAVMVYLDGHKLNVTIPLPGTYTIKIREPDYSTLTRQITVN
jgi:hypothetical protein